jgi:outer membrane lipoprotein SlyB
MIKNKVIVTILCILALSVTSCERNINSNAYTAASVGEASFSYQGTVISTRQVQVQEGDKLEDNKTGIGLGAVGGGLIGNQFGNGSGNVAATIGGAVVGGFLGSMAEKKLKEQNGFEYVVKLTNGQIKTVVQGLDAVFGVGQRVIVIVSNDGRSRVIADNSPIQDVQAPIQAPSVKIIKKR